MKKRRRSIRHLRGRREQKHVHWVFCEGKTEKQLLEGLQRRWRSSSVKITVVDQKGAPPKRVVEEAVAKFKGLKKASGAFTVHVVFDRDEHAEFSKAVRRAEEVGLALGVSNPCFELWALLLHQDQTAALDRKAAQSKLKKVHPRYDHERRKNVDVETVIFGLNQAAKRAETLRKRAREAGNRWRNPVTTFDQTLKKIWPEQGSG